MLDLTLRALAWVLNLCLPDPRGRHRAGTLPAPQLPPPRSTELLDGGASALVRPYVLTPAERNERRRQRERRRTLYLATLGIDTGPHHIHGIHVGAAR